MNCWTDSSGLFSKGPIKQLCFLPAAYWKCECVSSLTADTMTQWLSVYFLLSRLSSSKQTPGAQESPSMNNIYNNIQDCRITKRQLQRGHSAWFQWEKDVATAYIRLYQSSRFKQWSDNSIRKEPRFISLLISWSSKQWETFSYSTIVSVCVCVVSGHRPHTRLCYVFLCAVKQQPQEGGRFQPCIVIFSKYLCLTLSCPWLFLQHSGDIRKQVGKGRPSVGGSCPSFTLTVYSLRKTVCNLYHIL